MDKLSRPLTTGHFGANELSAMALVLEGRHGTLAADVAEFFSTTHLQCDDRRRGAAWAQVADIVREREARRIADAARHAGD